MKTNRFKYSTLIVFLCFLVACSTKKDTFLSRNSHALFTKYNVLYNGQIAFDKGITGLQQNTKDNFWERLPIERMQINDPFSDEEKPKNPDFEKAEEKATKAIQKHSMNIKGQERNYQIDEAYLLLGKARYYDQRFIPALDAFNYILYKYPGSDKIYEAKIWREKTNMRLGNDAIVVKNISKMLKERELDKQIYANANALLAESFLNLEQKDSAIAKLKIAVKFTKRNYEKARYRFILGQLYEELGKTDSANISYQSVIDMNRKSERKYVIYSQVRKAGLFNYQNGDTTLFVKSFKKLIANRENRPFLDILNYQMGVFYDKQNKQEQALSFYNESLKKATDNDYLMASDYRNIGDMYFNNASYSVAAKYYDSTLTKLNPKTREYIHIEKIRKDLNDVILYEDIANRNDSILNIVSLPEADRISYFENYIEKLKKEDEEKRIKEEKEKERQENIARNSAGAGGVAAVSGKPDNNLSIAPPSAIAGQAESIFYFYNQTTVDYGKVEFKRIWGNRKLGGNWRVSATPVNVVSNDSTIVDEEIAEVGDAEKEEVIKEYTTDFYLKQLPDSQKSVDSILKERNTAYYQLGVIYKEKFKEYALATDKLEGILESNPEEKLILPTMYNLYKIYQITDKVKAEDMKNRINNQYPDSRYAQIINNLNPGDLVFEESPEFVYNKLYKQFEDEEFKEVLQKSDSLIVQFSGEEIVPKLELLKAYTIGKQKGLDAYKEALNFVSYTYPNTEEGKKAKDILEKQIPLLEKINFSTDKSYDWRVLYRVANADLKDKKTAVEKIIKELMKDETVFKLEVTSEAYGENDSFIIIQSFRTKVYAEYIISVLKKNKIELPGIIITKENYRVIQIRKNLESYLEIKN